MFLTRSVFSPAVFPAFFLPAAAVLRENGDTISLSCDNLKEDHTKCDTTTWVFHASRGTTVELVTLGQIASAAVSSNKVHRLTVLENCSLEIKNIASEDAGMYYCRQYRSGEQQGQGTQVELAVVSSESFSPQILVDQSVQQISIISIYLVVTDDFDGSQSNIIVSIYRTT